jgi:hypothetical protein
MEKIHQTMLTGGWSVAARRTAKSAAQRAVAADGAAATVASGLFGTTIKDPSWLKVVRQPGRLTPGNVPKAMLQVPVKQAQELLRAVIRFVVDIPANTSTVVVWQRDGSELWVDVGTTTIACAEGLVTIGVDVGCDEIGRTRISVPIGVGSSQALAGLVMATIDRLDGPELVTARWSEAITAFAWESLVELARRLAAQTGNDKAGLPLIPGAIGASRAVLLIQPMSRNDLSGLGR